MSEMKRLCVQMSPGDNVVIAVQEISAGTQVFEDVVTTEAIPQGHKIAVKDIEKGGEIVRYGVVLGYAINKIYKGNWINEKMLTLPV